MTDTRPHYEPGPDHPITVEPAGEHITVRTPAVVIADTTKALKLQEADYPPTYYVPLVDVQGELLRPNDEHTYCPYKGEASYYDVVTPDGETIGSAVWYYPTPYPAVAKIAGHVAFYPDRVTVSPASS